MTDSYVKLVIFDVGGVLLYSPITVIRQVESELGIDQDALNRVLFLSENFAALERGEITLAAFCILLDKECRNKGLVGVVAEDLFERITQAMIPFEDMKLAVARLKSKGFKCAVITNNWLAKGSHRGAGIQRLDAEFGFDLVVESCVLGIRKPNPKIYQYVLDHFQVLPHEAVFLDDIGRNLKSARQLGIQTVQVKHNDTTAALKILGHITGVELSPDCPGFPKL